MLQNYLVVGLGVTGLSVVEYLRKRNATVTVTDTRTDPPYLTELQNKFPEVSVLLGQIVVPDNITQIILSPGLPINTPEIAEANANNIPVLGDIELFARVVDKPVMAVTGSNGKSTVTALLGAMANTCGMQVGVGGNLGTPALALLDSKNAGYILELSSFQLETTNSLRLKAATVLNISPDHMDRYSDVKAYNAAKLRIYQNAEVAVINRADQNTIPTANQSSKIVSFGLDAPTEGNFGVRVHNATQWLAKGTSLLLPTSEMALMGAHNVANALAALAMGEAFGFSMDAMLQTLRTFAGLEHRCEKIITNNNIVWVNDSKGTNVGATLAAIEGLSASITGKWVIILGGIGKNADFAPLRDPIAKSCKAAILIGIDAPKLWDLLHNTLPCFMAKDLSDVVSIAKQNTSAGDGVLLSPACASFDMFNNYMHRGDMFKQQVLQEIGSNATTLVN